MTITCATKKLEKAGYEVAGASGSYFATKSGNRHVIQFHRNGMTQDVTCIKVRAIGDHDDSMTDYSAGVFVDTITAAIKLAA